MATWALRLAFLSPLLSIAVAWLMLRGVSLKRAEQGGDGFFAIAPPAIAVLLALVSLFTEQPRSKAWAALGFGVLALLAALALAAFLYLGVFYLGAMGSI